MQSEILFDNIYIGHSPDAAAMLRAETFAIKRPAEDAAELASRPKVDDTPPTDPNALSFKDDPATYIRQKVELFISLAQKDPVAAVRFLPEVAGGLGAAAVAVIALVVGIVSVLSGGGAAAAVPSKEEVRKTAERAKAKAEKVKDQAVAAASSGAETVKTEVNKRTTRSSGGAE